MASFTDQTPQFNPYIQQQPVELMLKVAMEKQRRYDEGVQKIQTSIDNVAGLDIANPAQQEYLQSKLNELGSKLKTVAGGDFSNYQLVNSVGGMATQLGNDKVVQNAVGSTARVRKGQQEQEAARKAGKSHVDNDNYWSNDVNKYISSDDVNATFSDQYHQYTDVTKKLNELGEKLHAEDKYVESAYQRYNDGTTKYFDAKGNLTTKEKGQPRYDDAILAVTTKTKTAEKLLAAFYNNLDDNDRQQLKINAWSNYRGSTKETFIKDIQNNYANGKKMLEANVVDLAVKLKGANLSESDRTRYQTELNASTTALKDGSLDKSMQSKVAQLDKLNDGNIDAYKTQLYTEKHLSGLAQDLAYQDIKQEIKTNPYAQMALDRQKFQFQIDRARVEDYHSDRAYNLSVREAEYTRYKDQQERDGTGLIVTDGGIRTDVPKPTINDINRRATDARDGLIELQNSYLPNVMFKEDPNMDLAHKKVAADNLYKKYLINPNSINITDNNLRKYFNQRRALEIEQAQIGNLKRGADAVGKESDALIAAKLKSYQGVTLNGRHFTAKDLYDVNAVAETYIKSGRAVDGSPATARPSSFDTANFLKQYVGTPQQRLSEIIAKRLNGKALSSAENVIASHMNYLYGQNARFVRSIYKQKYDAQSSFLAEHMPEMQTQDASLNRDNKVDMAHADVLLADAAKDYNKLGSADVERSKDYNPNVINKWKKDNEELDYVIKKNYDGSASFVVQKGTEQQIIPIAAKNLGKYFPNAARSNPFNNIEAAIRSSPEHTTNLIGSRDPVNAYLTGEDLPLLKGTAVAHRVRFDIEGSAMTVEGEANNDFQLVMYVQRSDGTWTEPRVVNNKGYASQDGISGLLNQIGTGTVAEALK